MAQACRLIEVWGSPYERGVQYGRQAAAEIARAAAHYGTQIKRLNLTDQRFIEIIEKYLPLIEKFDALYVEEMRGIAAGSGVRFEEVVLINARTEVVQLALHPEWLGLIGPSEGCTSVVVRPSATRDKQLIHAHNWDWELPCAEFSVILKVRNTDKPDILTYTEAGALGRFGMNSRGICVTGNGLECDRDYRKLGVPVGLLRRKALEQTYLALAQRDVYETPKSGSTNVVISHGPSGLVHDFECAPDETFIVTDQDGILVHSNHWLSPIALIKLRETGIGSAPTTLYREQLTREALTAKRGDITIEDVKAALLDDFETPWSICYPQRPADKGIVYITVATLLMRPDRGEMQVCMLPALDEKKSFTTYSLEMDGPGTSSASHG